MISLFLFCLFPKVRDRKSTIEEYSLLEWKVTGLQTLWKIYLQSRSR
jgi:hypothetical protein